LLPVIRCLPKPARSSSRFHLQGNVQTASGLDEKSRKPVSLSLTTRRFPGTLSQILKTADLTVEALLELL
jgi:hypothetical protein